LILGAHSWESAIDRENEIVALLDEAQTLDVSTDCQSLALMCCGNMQIWNDEGMQICHLQPEFCWRTRWD